MRLIVLSALMSSALALPAVAHGNAPGAGPDAPLLWIAALLLALWHATGALRQWRPPVAAARSASFALGLALILVAITGPVAHWATEALAGHMVQHMLLLIGAPPLLLLGRPATALLRALPGPQRKGAASLFGSRLRSAAVSPVQAALLQAAIVSAWHIPAIFAAAETSAVLHELEHASFLAVAVLYWHGQIDPRGAGVGAVLASLLATIWCGFLGALLTFAPSPLFGTSLADQQLAGLLMWVPGSFAYLAGALAAFAFWIFAPRRSWTW